MIDAVIKIMLVVAALLIITMIFSIPTMLLWNWLMPLLFGLSQITLMQAWGLQVLFSLLFKSAVSKGN